MDTVEYVAQDFGTLDALVRQRVKDHPNRAAVIDGERRVSFAELDVLIDRAAAALQRDGVLPKEVVSICAASSIEYVALFIAILRVGATVTPLPPSATATQLAAMLDDCAPTHLFTDAAVSRHITTVASSISARRIAFDADASGQSFESWLAPEGSTPYEVPIDSGQPFNIIYSSGTTGTPKGIVQSHALRWSHIVHFMPLYTGPDSVTIVSTPFYSNTTLVSLLPALAGGATAVIMAKFEARRFLELCDRYRVTVATLVPVQYLRILELPNFDDFDLSSFRTKFSMSAPFSAELKREVLARWPGDLVEIYGMTEGGVNTMLLAHDHPDKLHTIGVPMGDLKIIDNEGRELPRGESGEMVGRSAGMMSGYLNKSEDSAETEWWSPNGLRYQRSGDIASVDDEGFVTLVGRKKDVIISGGFNIFPLDLENAVTAHPAVSEVAVIGKPSRSWGETPVAFVTLKPGVAADAEEIRAFANESLGKMQRISEVRIVESLPRSDIGKVLKRDLKDLVASAPE